MSRDIEIEYKTPVFVPGRKGTIVDRLREAQEDGSGDNFYLIRWENGDEEWASETDMLAAGFKPTLDH